jgi:uncharacterized protein
MGVDELEAINLLPSMVDKSYTSEPLVFSDEFVWKDEYQKFVAIMAHFNRYPYDRISPLTTTVIKRMTSDAEKYNNSPGLFKNDIPSGPCVAGKLRLFVTADGDFAPCERVSETSPAMRIGSLKTGFDVDKILGIINVAQLTRDECVNCWAFKECMMCAKFADVNQDELSGTERLRHCEGAIASAYYKHMIYIMLDEIPRYYPDHITEESD